MVVSFTNFLDTHIEDALRLWNLTEWASISNSDKPQALALFLKRNEGCSWVAVIEGRLAGTVLVGHDLRRGYIYHLVVDEMHRGKGIGKALLDRALDSLRNVGVLKCHAIVINGNPAAEYFWSHHGWQAQETTQYSSFLS